MKSNFKDSIKFVPNTYTIGSYPFDGDELLFMQENRRKEHNKNNEEPNNSKNNKELNR